MSRLFKIIVIGNGWNIHLNDNLKNFNQNFSNWINDIWDSINGDKEIFRELWKTKNAIFSWLDIEEDIEEYFGFSIQHLNLSNKMEPIESKIKNVGDLYNSKVKNRNYGYEKFLKNIYGYYIDVVCKNIPDLNKLLALIDYESKKNVIKNSKPSFKNSFLEFSDYDLVLTTNYNNYIQKFLKIWQCHSVDWINDFWWDDDYIENKVINIHGSYLEIERNNAFSKYNDIQINFNQKNAIMNNLNKILTEDIFDECFTMLDGYQSVLHIGIDFYGMSLINDDHIVSNIYSSIKEIIIDYEPPAGGSIDVSISNEDIKYYSFEIDQESPENHILYKVTEEFKKWYHF